MLDDEFVEIRLKREKKKPHPHTGKKHALGHGRPITYTEEFKDKEYDDLIEWSRNPNSRNFLEFTKDRPYENQSLRFWSYDNSFYRDKFNKAKDNLALNLRNKLRCKDDPHNYGLFMREIAMYDRELHHFENEKKIFDAELKVKSEKENQSEELKAVIGLNQQLMSQISQLQSALKRDSSNISKDM